jgi:hypothetical protein
VAPDALEGDVERAVAERAQVLDRGHGPGYRLVGLGAGLEAVAGRSLGRGAHAVGGQRFGQVGADRGDAQVRPEELVGRAEQHVEAPLGGAEAPVRRQVHAVGPGERAGGVGGRRDASRVGERADRVRGQREGDHPGALADQALERVVVEGDVAGADRGVAHDQVVVGGQEQPGRHVGVVVELRDDDLVARAQRAGDRVREQEVERRHVGAEGDPLRLAAGEVRGGCAAAPHHLVGGSRGREGAAEVGVRAAQVGGHRVEHLARALRAARSVEEGGVARERGEALPHRLDVKRRRAAA